VQNIVSHIKEKYKVRVFESRVMRRLFGPDGGSNRRMEEVAK
jgi:hypothetical protein